MIINAMDQSDSRFINKQYIKRESLSHCIFFNGDSLLINEIT